MLGSEGSTSWAAVQGQVAPSWLPHKQRAGACAFHPSLVQLPSMWSTGPPIPHLVAPWKRRSAASWPTAAAIAGRCTSHFSRGYAVLLPGMVGYRVKGRQPAWECKPQRCTCTCAGRRLAGIDAVPGMAIAHSFPPRRWTSRCDHRVCRPLYHPCRTLPATPCASKLDCSRLAVAGSGSKACTAATLAASRGSSRRRRQKRPMLAPLGANGGRRWRVEG